MRTANTPYSPLERKEETGRAAAVEDHAAVNLSVWALPDETLAQANVRERIHKHTVACVRLEKDARWWLREHQEHTEQDVGALDDCVRRARACSYWE